MKEIRIQNYQILGRIGKGGEGAVYKAYDSNLKQYVVLKRLNDSVRGTPHTRREVDILKNLNHTNLPHLLNYLETEYGVFTVMNYIDGTTLKSLVESGRTFRKSELLEWAKSLCGALQYLHSREIPIIHGDIKPSNIMLTPAGDIFLIDFGISFLLDENAIPAYSQGYTSPEQYYMAQSYIHGGNGKWTIDQRSDIYSLGATIYYLATRTRHDNFNESVDERRLEEILGIPFAQIILKALNNDQENRYQTAAEMLNELDKVNRNDNRYLNLVRRQKLRTTLLAMTTMIWLIVSACGIRVHQAERYAAYKSLIEEQVISIRNENYPEAEIACEKAIKMMPKEMDAYYWNADALYLMGEYTSAIDYIQYSILSNDVIKKNTASDRQNLIDVYVLLGRCYSDSGDSSRAVRTFQDAEEIGELSPSDLRSYAIALALNGRLSDSEDMLERAGREGANPAEIAYTHGELSYQKKQYQDAADRFREALKASKDNDLRQHAYLMLDKIYRKMGDAEIREAVLDEAVKALPEEYLLPVYERYAQLELDTHNFAGAAKWLHKTDEENRNSWEHYDLLARCYYNAHNDPKLYDMLTALSRMKFDRKYRIDMWKALALYRAENYSEGEIYYHRAVDSYETSQGSDSDMKILMDTHNKLAQEGYV